MTKYDLQTLLAVKPNAHIGLDRFSDQAFTNNLVRPNVLSEQSVNRPRNVSGHSRRTPMAGLAMNTQNNPRQPSQSSLPSNSQFDDAFVRFVEQHTSPKPQRVTAGGRIVPMNPWDSPPKWSLPMSSKGASAANSETSKTVPTAARSEPKSRSENSAKQEINFSEGKAVKTAPLPAEAANAPCFQPLANSPSPFPYARTPMARQQIQGSGLPTYPSFGIGGDNFLGTNPSTAMGQVPTFPFQPHASPAATPSFSGWNSISTATASTLGPYQAGYLAGPPSIGTQWPQISQMSPMPQVPQVHQTPQLPQLPTLPQLPPLPPLSQIPQASPAISNQGPAVNQQFVPSYFQEAIYQKSLDDATKQYEALSAQLSQIDRFTAMHTWVIEPETKKLLVEQRKSLVRELDTVRLYKEHLQVLFGKPLMSATPVPQRDIAVPVTPSQNGAWETPTKSKSKSLSPTVRNLYRTIEETDQRGEPIDGLLRALSGASKGLAKRLSEERKKTLRVPTKDVAREVLNNTFARVNEEPLQEAPAKAEYAQPVQVSRRLWQSEPHPHSPLLSQCFNNNWSPVLQKSAAPAVSQNVTAHAFLPSFDGAGRTSDDFELV
ncbi:hypothetical protein ASPCAL04377 [Aspergillus calidoustus]|uniref:Uncharacterized protein n=1 Tax=Aspergillus calidoustus TaxID=454130 RepID=A0A0U5GR17_ASPCI|nr:hypothetical protein ASPCAL04377 [Aspergillus calidoustus]